MKAETSQTWIGGISSPPKYSMKPWALTVVRTAHSTSEGHTLVCCGCKGGCGWGRQQRWHWKRTENRQRSCAGFWMRRKKKCTFQNKLCKVWAGFESQERRDEPRGLRQPASTAAPCVPCNQEVTKMGLPCLRLPPTDPSQAARNMCGLAAAASAEHSVQWCQLYTRELS